jgi:hypothetical protein
MKAYSQSYSKNIGSLTFIAPILMRLAGLFKQTDVHIPSKIVFFFAFAGLSHVLAVRQDTGDYSRES